MEKWHTVIMVTAPVVISAYLQLEAPEQLKAAPCKMCCCSLVLVELLQQPYRLSACKYPPGQKSKL